MNIYKRIGLIILFFGAMVLFNNYIVEDNLYGDIARVFTVGCAGAFTYNVIRITDYTE